MSGKLWNLRKIIDLVKWQTLQDSIAAATKMAIITVDYKGIPVTEHSLCNPFCQEVRKDPELFQHCKKCDARGGLEAVRQNAPYIYYCHCHIIDFAVPITVDDKYLGAVMAGQVRLLGDDQVPLEQIVTVSGKSYEQKKAALSDLYYDMPVLSFHEVQLVAEMLSRLANYITEEAVHKNLIIEVCEKMQRQENALELADAIVSNTKVLRRTVTNTALGDCLEASNAEAYDCANTTLKPIFSYLHAHRCEAVPLKKAAALCHISTSHFSRLFVKETGENYSNYIAQLKIKWSKALLVKTDMSVARVSEELGYNEAGYFIKTFKKYEGMTPLLYRKHYAG